MCDKSARALAERAVALAPDAGESWFALGLANLYAASIPAGARALRRALERATGHAMAQAILGGILLEVGGLDDAIAHLEASRALDPEGSHFSDLPRAYIYLSNRYDDAFAVLERARAYGRFAGFQHARLRLWQGKLTDITESLGPHMPPGFAAFLETTRVIYRTGTMSPSQRTQIDAIVAAMSPRLRAANSQFIAEFLVHIGDLDGALGYIEIGVDAGLQDRVWLERCPMLARLRERPRFQELAAIVGQRADAVLAAVRE